MKKLLSCMLLMSLGCSTIAQTNIDELDEQMKSFRSRVRVYAKCLTGKCTKQERNAAAKAALKDGAMVAGTLALVGLTIGIGFGGRWLYTKKQKKDLLQRLEYTSGFGGVGALLQIIQDALKVAVEAEKTMPNKKLSLKATSSQLEALGSRIDLVQEVPDAECQTEVNQTVGDVGSRITLKRCDNQVNVEVLKLDSLTQVGAKVLLDDLYRESRIYRLNHAPFIQKLKSDNNIEKIIVHIPLTDEKGNKVTKIIEL